MGILLFVLYFTFFVYGFKLYGLDKRVSLPFSVLVCLFLSKVLLGCLNLHFHNSEYLSNDAHYFYLEALSVFKDFEGNPIQFLKEWLFNWGDIHHHLNFLDKENSFFWADIGRLMHTKFMVLSTILSFGHEYVNVIFYNVVYFLGQLALLKTLLFFREDKKWLFIIILFFLPGVSFWCSGIHKDGFVLATFGFVSWATIKFTQKSNPLNLSYLLGSLLLMLGIRYFYFLFFVPAYLTWFLTKKSKSPLQYFAIVYVIGACIFFNAQRIHPKINFMQMVVSKQADFYNSKGYSDMYTPQFSPEAHNFIKYAPVALKHIFLEPLSKLGERIKYDITAIDTFLLLLIIFISLFFLKRRYFNQGYFWVLILFSFSILLFIGYTVPNLGALVRYKSPFMILLISGLIGLGDMPNPLAKLKFK